MDGTTNELCCALQRFLIRADKETPSSAKDLRLLLNHHRLATELARRALYARPQLRCETSRSSFRGSFQMARLKRFFLLFRRPPQCAHPRLQLDDYGDVYCVSCGRDFTD